MLLKWWIAELINMKSCSIMLSSPFSNIFQLMTFHVYLNQMKPVIFFLLFQRFYGSSISWEITSYLNQMKYRDTKISYLMQIWSQPRSMWKCLSQTPREFDKTHAILTKIFMNRSWFLHISSLSSLLKYRLSECQILVQKIQSNTVL